MTTSAGLPYASILLLLSVSLNPSWSSALACPCAEFKSPQRTVDVRKGLVYMSTAGYRQEAGSALSSARRACERHLGEAHVAVVSDIDETLLDNSQVARQSPDDFWKGFRAYEATASAPLLKGTAAFLSWARKHGFAVFLVTGRNESERLATIENLLRDGVAYDGLFMRAVGDKRSAAVYKPAVREEIEKMGFKIVVNIGDQPTDLLGGHAEDCELLPNLMYSVP